MPSAARLVADHVLDLRAAQSGRLVVGLSGAQGSGKSTVAAQAVEHLARSGIAAAVLSLDDFYLTKAQRRRLSEMLHPLLAVRGPPGTHDIPALSEATRRLRGGEAATSPTFDKLADDQARPTFGRTIQRVDVVLLEGWCIGAEPETAAQLARPVNDLERSRDPDGRWRAYVNDALAGPYRALFQRLNGLIFLRAPGFEVVAAWRGEQERSNRSLRGKGSPMSPDAIATFVQHYERITRRMISTPPTAVTLMLALDEARRVTEATAPPAPRRESR